MKDEQFLREQKVPMTKEMVRALVLSRLVLAGAEVFIDIGAGTGSVTLEAAITHQQLQVIAIEKNSQALALLAANIEQFSCHNVEIVEAIAPVAIEQKADAIFIGGSGGNLKELIDWSLAQLHEGGRLVLTFILQENLMMALSHLQCCQVEELSCEQLQMATLTTLGSGHYFKPNNPTFLISCVRERKQCLNN